MSEFILSIKTNIFCVHKAGTELPADHLVIGIRDPELPLEWKAGSYYYNPFYERHRVFIYRDDERLATIDGTGFLQAPKQSRTWFEIIPQPITQIYGPLQSMIQAIPQQTTAIGQALLQHLGVRVPAEFKPQNPEDWDAWLAGVRVPVGETFKAALANTSYQLVAVAKDVEVEFKTGKTLPPGVTVWLRAVQVRERIQKVREIYDSSYVKVTIPRESLRSKLAVQAWLADQELALRGKLNLDKDPVSTRILEDRSSRESPITIIGYEKGDDGAWINLWNTNTAFGSINDLFREILAETET